MRINILNSEFLGVKINICSLSSMLAKFAATAYLSTS